MNNILIQNALIILFFVDFGPCFQMTLEWKFLNPPPVPHTLHRTQQNVTSQITLRPWEFFCDRYESRRFKKPTLCFIRRQKKLSQVCKLFKTTPWCFAGGIAFVVYWGFSGDICEFFYIVWCKGFSGCLLFPKDKLWTSFQVSSSKYCTSWFCVNITFHSCNHNLIWNKWKCFWPSYLW